MSKSIYAMRLIILLAISIIPAAHAHAQDQTSENMRGLAIRVSFSAVVAQKLQIGELVDLYWTSNPGLDQWGAEKRSITRFVAGDLKLLSFQQPQFWQETETGFSAIATISINPNNLSIILDVPEDGRYMIVSTE